MAGDGSEGPGVRGGRGALGGPEAAAQENQRHRGPHGHVHGDLVCDARAHDLLAQRHRTEQAGRERDSRRVSFFGPLCPDPEGHSIGHQKQAAQEDDVRGDRSEAEPVRQRGAERAVDRHRSHLPQERQEPRQPALPAEDEEEQRHGPKSGQRGPDEASEKNRAGRARAGRSRARRHSAAAPTTSGGRPVRSPPRASAATHPGVQAGATAIEMPVHSRGPRFAAVRAQGPA